NLCLVYRPLCACGRFLLYRRRPPPGSTLFPYTTLFRSRRSTSANDPSGSQSRSTVASGPTTLTIRARARSSEQPTTAGRKPCSRSEEHTSELQSREKLVCRLLLEKKKRWAGQALDRRPR